MAQHDYIISNQGFPATRSDINNVLNAIATLNSGTSAPATQYAGQLWVDTTSATAWILYIYDGSDNIQLATINTSTNTVNFTDSALDVLSDTTPQLGGNLDVNGNSIVSVSNGNIAITPDGTGRVVLDGINYPSADGSANQILQTNGSATLSFTDTLTNKRVDPRVTSTTSASSITPDVSTTDIVAFTALAADLTINAPIGTPVNGNKLIFRILDNGTSRTLTWNATYTVIGVTLPTSTTVSKTVYVGCIYNSAASRWDVVSVITQL